MAVNKLWNTGVDDSGNQLPIDRTDRKDPHWRLIRAPNVMSPDVWVLKNNVPQYFGTSDARWVWANTDGLAERDQPYVFETDFTIDVSFKHYWLEITGLWGADNYGHLEIDGRPLPLGSGKGETSLPSGILFDNFQHPHGFSISQAHPPSQSQLHLTEGAHTLQVWVYNEGEVTKENPNPAGFIVSSIEIIRHPLVRINLPPPPHR